MGFKEDGIAPRQLREVGGEIVPDDGLHTKAAAAMTREAGTVPAFWRVPGEPPVAGPRKHRPVVRREFPGFRSHFAD